MRQIKLLFTALTAIFLMGGILLAQDTTMTITNNGYVGIGIINPAAPLHVLGTDGSGIIHESEFGDRLFIYYSGEDGLVMDSWRPSDARRLPLIFQPIGGNVGIGTYTPSAKLDVNGNATISGSLNLQSGFRATGPNGSFWFTPEFSPGATVLLGVYTGFGAFPVLRFVESNDSQAYVDIGQNGDGNFTVASPAGQLITADRTTGDTNVKGNLSANSINTGAEALKIVRGSIDVDGTIRSGTGFTVTKDDVGEFTITFTEPFSDFPTVTGSTVNPGVVTVAVLAPGTFVTIRTRQIFDNSQFDTFFSFVAVGGAGVPPAAAEPVITADK